MLIDADGVILGAFTADDAPDLRAALADDEILRWNPGPVRDDAVAKFIAARNDWDDGPSASWAVADDAGRLVGAVSVHRIDADQQNAEIGYWTAPWARRRGYAVRAVSLATGFAFGNLGPLRLRLYHAVENGASCAVAVAAGVAQEGTLRQSYRYADGAFHDEHLHARLSSDPAVSPHV